MTKNGIKLQAYGPCVPITKYEGTSFANTLKKVTAAVSERAGKEVANSQVLLKLAATLGAIVITTTGKVCR